MSAVPNHQTELVIITGLSGSGKGTVLKAFEDLRAKKMLCIHHSTFRLSLERMDEPRQWMEALITEKPELKERVCSGLPGVTLET